MYLKGSRLSMNKKRRRGNPWIMGFLLLAIAALVWVNIFVVPNVPPPFVPTPTETRSPELIRADADQLVQEGQFIAAIAAYQTAINAEPTNLQNYLKIARLQIYAGLYDEARVNCENAILLNNRVADAYAMLGWVKGTQGDYRAGETTVRQAIAIDPNSALAHAVMARLLGLRVELGLDELGTQDAAIEESRTAIALNPGLLEARWFRGYILEITGNYEKATAEYEAAVAINSYVADLRMALGRSYLALERYDDSIREFTAANGLNPQNPTANRMISRVWERQGEWEKAMQYGREALKIDPNDPELYANMGTFYFRAGRYNQALPYLELAVKGGSSSEFGGQVTGLPISYSNTIIGLYSRYGIALARVNRCSEAFAISTMMKQTVADDEIGMINAEEMIKICQENLTNPPTEIPTPTPTVQTGPSPTPPATATPPPPTN
jgi:tetratricopeptide (TPR) repeat protein